MIFKLPKPKKEKNPYKFGEWLVMSNSKKNAQKDLKRFLKGNPARLKEALAK
jgi:hypothetical protein